MQSSNVIVHISLKIDLNRPRYSFCVVFIKYCIMATPHQHLRRFYITLFILTIVLGLANVIYLLCQPDATLKAVLFCGLQYVAMFIILALPIVLRKRFLLNVPLILTIAIAVFAFVAMVLGDGLNFYGRYPWWDSLLHLFSGGVLSFIGLWVVHILLSDEDKVIFRNKYFLALFLLMFSLACGAIWEICEYTYDDLFGTNTQQFMETTTSSIYSEEDIPLEGHEALRDTMTDLTLDFLGGLIVALIVLFRHNAFIEKGGKVNWDSAIPIQEGDKNNDAVRSPKL